MKKNITAEITNPEVLEYASEEFTKLLFEFYIEAKEAETKVSNSVKEG
ncbi:MAG: hypothetical protein Q8933_09390 [Bacteroidota bacterium]|nr:hypothetical protein [Bacteroidota bacterium]